MNSRRCNAPRGRAQGGDEALGVAGDEGGAADADGALRQGGPAGIARTVLEGLLVADDPRQ